MCRYGRGMRIWIYRNCSKQLVGVARGIFNPDGFGDGLHPGDFVQKVMFEFICEYESGECRTSEESSEVLWVPREKVLDYITSPVLRYRFEKILNFDGKITYASYVTRPEFKVITERYI